MLPFCSVLLLSLVYIPCSSSYSLLEPNDELTLEEFTWPPEYHFEGEEINLHTGIKEDFKIWYSTELNRSRIDYYGGLEKKYYYGETENVSATIYLIHYVTAEDEIGNLVCSELPGDGEPKNFLPGIQNLTYIGEKNYLNRKLQVWEKEKELEGSLKVVMTINAYIEDGFHVPVQTILKVYNYAKGTVDDHTITTYHLYENEVETGWLNVDFEEPECSVPSEIGSSLKKDLEYLRPGILEDSDFAFNRYKAHHGKEYDDEEYEVRRAIFHNNWKFVEEQNKKNLGYRLEVNSFADRTEEELRFLTGTRPSANSHAVDLSDWQLLNSVETLPDELDLRLDGVISPVKNQADCGSCWAFSSTAAVEGAIARKNGGRDLDLSEQSLIDCAWGYNNTGCSGGTIDGVMRYILANGIPKENDYGRYLMKEGICEIKNMSKVYNIIGFGQVTPRNVESMKAALYKYGPVVVGVYAGRRMKLYSSGIFYDVECEGETMNHGVTVVGYGVRDGDTYWIVKNSWGESWGEDGYILISATNNNCLLLDMAYYPIA